MDAEIVPIERVVAAEADQSPAAPLRIATPAGARSYRLPPEFVTERTVMRNLVARWEPRPAGRRLRRVYAVPRVEPDERALEAFGQVSEARSAVADEGSGGDVQAPSTIRVAPASATHRP